MHAERRQFGEQWRDEGVWGSVIQIRGESLLFKPRPATQPLWLFLDGSLLPAAGAEAQLVINPAVFDCKRLIPRHGESVKLPCLSFHKDELERARGRFVRLVEGELVFVLDVGFPLVVSLLQDCQELRRARPGEILEMDFAPPAQGHRL
jgi:hypothetical protein